MLDDTLILPESDGRLAARLFRDAVEALDIVLMLVFGKDDRATQIVTWADRLCKKTQTADGNLRMVVWFRDTSTQAVMAELARVLDSIDPLPRVAVLNFFDVEKARLIDDDAIDPIQLELAFLKGHRS